MLRPATWLLLAVGFIGCLAGCDISESGDELRAKDNPDSLKPVAQRNLHRFEDAVQREDFEGACGFLTEFAMRQILGTGRDKSPPPVPRKHCPLLLAITAKGAKTTFPRFQVTKVESGDFKGTTYLIVHTSPGPGVVMTVDAKRIASFTGPQH